MLFIRWVWWALVWNTIKCIRTTFVDFTYIYTQSILKLEEGIKKKTWILLYKMHYTNDKCVIRCNPNSTMFFLMVTKSFTIMLLVFRLFLMSNVCLCVFLRYFFLIITMHSYSISHITPLIIKRKWIKIYYYLIYRVVIKW